MIISNRHPAYAGKQARLERLLEVKRLCRLKLAAARTAKKDG